MGKGKKGVRKGRDSAPAAASKKEERAAKRQLKKQKGRRFGDKEERDFEAQVQTLGGTIHHQASDGNCLFRSINDQLEGTSSEAVRTLGESAGVRSQCFQQP